MNEVSDAVLFFTTFQTINIDSNEKTILRSSMFEVAEIYNVTEMTELNNKIVYLLRASLKYQSSREWKKIINTNLKKDPSITSSARREILRSNLNPVLFREGLKVPGIWKKHADNLILSNEPVVISGILQNALFFNPLNGEQWPWRNC